MRSIHALDQDGAQTKFQCKGIKGVDLTEEERNALIEQGLDPDDVNFEGTELEKTVSNLVILNTIMRTRQVWRTVAA